MADSEKLFDRLGGADALVSIVEAMYARVLEDPELAPYFENVSMARLREMQFQFLASAFGGPVHYTGAELTAIHTSHGITAHDFARFCGHFADVLEARGIAKQEIDDALGRLAMYKDKITGDGSTGG